MSYQHRRRPNCGSGLTVSHFTDAVSDIDTILGVLMSKMAIF